MTALPATNDVLPASEAGTGTAPTLVIRTLGRSAVLVNGKEAQWQSQGAHELFFYLLSHPEGRTKEEILSDLWSLDLDPASLNRYRVTAHRLKAALRMPGALREEFGRQRLSPEVFQASDVQDLYAALHEAETAGNAPGKLRGYQRAISAYGGDFLPHEHAEWALAAREEHQAAYVRACVELSLLHCDQHECEGAVQALVRALKVDPFIGENYHQKLMTCLSVVQDKYAAIEHYRRFLKFLQTEVSDTPMSETTDLAQRIKCGEQICRPDGRAARRDLSCPLTPGGDCPPHLSELLTLN